ncbi:hypothetical protein PSH58_11175 [Pseudomonas hefeiensis]|nr:hypothetical protein [Pseudomonas sp. FP53]WLH97870.1 hypothetical protein PSH58_11175 [Pseudomonas sp. FP53]
MLSRNSAEYARQSVAGTLPDIAKLENRFGWQVLTIGHSDRQAEYHEEAIRKIVRETGGRFLDVSKNDAEMLIYNLVTSVYIGRVFRGMGSGGTSFGIAESAGLLPGVFRAGEKIVETDRQPGGAIISDGKEGFWTWSTESRILWAENILASEANTSRGITAMLRGFLMHFYMVSQNPSLGMMGFLAGPLTNLFGRHYSNVDDWMRKIKRTVDPRNTAVESNYVSPNKPVFSTVWRYSEKILFSPVGRPLFNAVTKFLGKKGVQKHD